MKFILNPCPVWHNTKASVNSLIVTVDGTDYDLFVIPEGGQAEAEDGSPFIGIITRDVVTINYCYDSTKAEPLQSTDWADYTFEIESGDVPCPIRWLPEPEPEILWTNKTMSYYQPLLSYKGGENVSEEH
ncbi:hypothetical protein M6C35_000292 [Vibrio metschnikovii]|nr:hypothetical protein [Vibrio metschnikovii]EKO3713217.1 hypothetical protein [Vibrio metschnikovii]EKO3738234.1 hypothetical protein [Vibrio metschnikovii]